MVVVGTESGVDQAKAVASYVQGLLELPTAIRTFDTQHACYGGTAGLMAAADRIVLLVLLVPAPWLRGIHWGLGLNGMWAAAASYCTAAEPS